MELDYMIKQEKMIIRMPKEIDHHRAQSLSKEIDMRIETQGIRTLVFDFSDTEFMDSSGIGVIIGRGRLLGYYGGGMYAIHLGERMKRIFSTSGLSRFIQVREG